LLAGRGLRIRMLFSTAILSPRPRAVNLASAALAVLSPSITRLHGDGSAHFQRKGLADSRHPIWLDRQIEMKGLLWCDLHANAVRSPLELATLNDAADHVIPP